MLKQHLGLISAIINIIAVVPYVYAVLRNQAQPNRVTWTIWTFLSWVIFAASAASGAKSTLFWLGSAAFNSTLIAGLSFWRGVWQKSNLEAICFGLGIAGIMVWYITHKAYWSVYIGSFVDLTAILPTVKKVWQLPQSEPIAAWSIGFVSAILNVAAIDQTRAVIIIPPLVVVIWHLLVIAPMYLAKTHRRATV